MTFTLSVLAGISTAVSGLFKARERWAINRRHLSPLYGEGVRFATLSAGYEGFETHGAAFDKFSLAVEKMADICLPTPHAGMADARPDPTTRGSEPGRAAVEGADLGLNTCIHAIQRCRSIPVSGSVGGV